MRPSIRKWLFTVLAIALLYAASTRLVPLNAQRAQAHLVMPPLPDTVRPSMLLSPLLAIGRAPLVDYLWMRATKLKDEKRYFDAYQLSQMICELQPKFASVWAFQAWNMSYNISVTCKTPEERWRWVRNGYELLRDKAIPLNPNNSQLYRELSWILFHKVGDFMDEMHDYYKLQFALEVEDILGEPPADFARPGRVRGDFYREYDFKSLADAPKTYKELIAQPDVARVAEDLRKFGFDISENGVLLNLLNSLKEDKLQVPGAEEYEQEGRRLELHTFLTDPDNADALGRIETFWRAFRLRNELKLEPERILRLEKDFGVSFDYRMPGTHGMYWASLGVEKGSDMRVNIDVHKLNVNRIEFYAIQKMFHRGRMAMSPQAKRGEPPLLSPDIRMIPVLKEAFLRDSKKYLSEEKQKTPISINFQTGFIGFMRRAILRYHEAGKQEEAQELFDYLVEHFLDPAGMYDNGIDGFLAIQYRGDRELNDYPIALARIRALIGRGLICLAYGEDEDAGRFIGRARKVYVDYQTSIVGERLAFQFTFSQILKNCVHEFGGRMYRASYESICQKLNIEPLPEPGEKQNTAKTQD